MLEDPPDPAVAGPVKFQMTLSFCRRCGPNFPTLLTHYNNQ